MSPRYLFCVPIDVWDWPRSSWYRLVSFDTKLMLSRISIQYPEEAMASIYRASHVSLHVRKSNRAALALYRDTLGFTVKEIEKGYC
jgi:hypothetical protein